MTLVILIAAIQKTTREDTSDEFDAKKVMIWCAGLVFIIVFLLAAIKAFQHMPAFGEPTLRMAQYYIDNGLSLTGASNLVAAIILDFRAYDTLGEATVLFTSVAGVVVVLRKMGRKRA